MSPPRNSTRDLIIRHVLFAAQNIYVRNRGFSWYIPVGRHATKLEEKNDVRVSVGVPDYVLKNRDMHRPKKILRAQKAGNQGTIRHQ